MYTIERGYVTQGYFCYGPDGEYIGECYQPHAPYVDVSTIGSVAWLLRNGYCPIPGQTAPLEECFYIEAEKLE